MATSKSKKAAPKRDDTTTDPSIEAAGNALEKATNQPGKMTDKDIAVATQDDGTDLPHNTANADAADAMAQDRAAAHGKPDPDHPRVKSGEHGYHHGQGGGAGL